MDAQNNIFGLLDMMIQPVFCVKDNIIIHTNAPAQQMLVRTGESILPLLESGTEEYTAFTGGCLYLALRLHGQHVGASVRKMDGIDVFEVDTEQDDSALRAMALAAMELRKPLSGALSSASVLLETQTDPSPRQQLSQLNRELYRILRLLGNMSDAESCFSHCRMETGNIPAILRDIFEKAKPMVARYGITLDYQDLPETVFCLSDRNQLERAVLNLLSNAAKFSPAGSRIRASLARRGRTLLLTIEDSGGGIAQDVMGNLFLRHRRQPGIEDSRFGIGLGMRLVHAAAIHHGGTLLVTQGEEGGTRIVLTIAIRQNEPNRLNSPIFEVDYTGGFDHSLVELSDILPADLYDGSF